MGDHLPFEAVLPVAPAGTGPENRAE